MKVLRILALWLALMTAVVSHADAKPLGKLGQATAVASIYSRMTSSSRVYYHCKAYEYLIVREANSRWTAVVMENGQLGYIAKTKVAVLPYTVTTRSAQTPPPATTSRGSAEARALLANYSLNYVGTPYKWGGNDLNRGIDCSGFVQQLYGGIGINLPRTAREQAKVGQPITRLEDLKPGDRLYFWDARKQYIGHTGLYLGNGYFVHASSNHGEVATDDLRNPHWRNKLVAARR